MKTFLSTLILSLAIFSGCGFKNPSSLSAADTILNQGKMEFAHAPTAPAISATSFFISEVHAADAPPQLSIPADADPAAIILNVVTNWKTMGGYALAMTLAMVAGLIVRSYVKDQWKYKRLLMAGISLLFGVAKQFAEGNMNVAAVLISALITYGGAKYIYDELRDAGVLKTKALAAA